MTFSVHENRCRYWTARANGKALKRSPSHNGIYENAVWFRTAEEAEEALKHFFPEMRECTRRPFKRRTGKVLYIKAPPERGVFTHERKDCTVNAFKQVTAVDYEKAHELFKTYGRVDNHGFHPEIILGNQLGVPVQRAGHVFTKVDHWRPGMRGIRRDIKLRRVSAKSGYARPAKPHNHTVRSFIEQHPVGTFYACTFNHAFAIYDGAVVDYTGVRDLHRLVDVWQVEKL